MIIINKNRNHICTIIVIFVAIITLVYIETVVFCVLNSTMAITGDAVARVDKDIRITSVELNSTEDSGVEIYSPDYSVNTITTGVKLNSLYSKVNYKLKIINFIIVL